MKVALRRLLVAVLVLAPVSANAAALAPRNIQVGSSGQGVTTSYTINATTATAASIGSIRFAVCTTASGACVAPDSVTSAATLTAQNPAGFTLDNTTPNSPFVFDLTPALFGVGTAFSYTLGNITNPSTANLTYYVRVTTFTGTDAATGPVDTGTVALSTAQPVQLTGVTPEILTFCVGTSIGANCTTVAGNAIDFGDFSPTSTNFGTSVMQAQTNAANGYVISVNGSTLTSGVNTIPGLGVQTPSVIGTSQFGTNVVDNATPNVGANPSGPGSGGANVSYGTADQYRFVSGNVVAQAAVPTDANTFTSSYIVNIGGSQAAGVYTATMTYICTAAF